MLWEYNSKGSDVVTQVSRLMTVAKEVHLACAEELFEISQFLIVDMLILCHCAMLIVIFEVEIKVGK